MTTGRINQVSITAKVHPSAAPATARMMPFASRESLKLQGHSHTTGKASLTRESLQNHSRGSRNKTAANGFEGQGNTPALAPALNVCWLQQTYIRQPLSPYELQATPPGWWKCMNQTGSIFRHCKEQTTEPLPPQGQHSVGERIGCYPPRLENQHFTTFQLKVETPM